MTLREDITVHGLVPGNTDDYQRGLKLTRDTETLIVPVVGVRYSAYNHWQGYFPDELTYTRVYLSNDAICADTFLPDGSTVILSESESGDGWVARHNPGSIPDHSKWHRHDSTDLWRHPQKPRLEFELLLEQGLSPAETLDYWANNFEGIDVTDWADTRDVAHQTVSENISKARDKMQD